MMMMMMMMMVMMMLMMTMMMVYDIIYFSLDQTSMPGLVLGIPRAGLLGFFSLRSYLGSNWQFPAGPSGVLCRPGPGEPFGGLGWIQG